MIRTSLFIAAVCLVCSCGRSKPALSPVDTGVDSQVQPDVDAGSGTGGTGAGLAPCLDQPTDLPRPPAGRLPCELIPPDLK